LQKRVRDVAAARAAGLPTVPSTMALEKATNPFLRCAAPEVVKSAANRKANAQNPVEVFTVLREWRNGF
jgi:hydroxyacylglutathione hydrolase